jgi:hypothetical protein
VKTLAQKKPLLFIVVVTFTGIRITPSKTSMKYILPFITFLTFFGYSQDYQLLTPEEKAYLFHIVKKSPILEQNIGRFIEYQGPEVLLPNGDINYDSIEEYMINHPETLVIREEEIAKSPKGLLAEAANKMAIWELNKALIARKDDEGDTHYFLQYERFEKLLMGHLPNSAFKTKKDSLVLHQKMHTVFNPSLSLDDKKAMMRNFRFMDIYDVQNTLNALSYATNTYVEDRSLEIYKALGGEVKNFSNVLVAAGDGSSTTGLLEEREKDERGRWNRGLPKAIGLFPYQTVIAEEQVTKKRTEQSIEPRRISTTNFLTPGDNKMTNIHLDVWGYNSEKQTTVVIEKHGKSYRLFGSGSTRFLSPDSNFAVGATYQSIINDLEFNKLAKVNEKIYGKRGYDHWIAYNQKRKDETEIKIQKAEKRYSDYGYRPISTNDRASRKVRKAKKKSSVLSDYQPTTNAKQTSRHKTQQEIIGLNQLYDAYRKKIKDLEYEKANALDILATYQLRLDQMKRAFGTYPIEFKEKDGFYTFADSTTFDIRTQEFMFPASPDTIPFEIRLIAIPESSLSKNADEVMLHINVMDARPNYNARIQLQAKDLFDSDDYKLNTQLIHKSDSVSVRLFMEALLNKDLDFEVIARGQGIGNFDGQKVIRDKDQLEMPNYPGDNPEIRAEIRNSDNFAVLRLSEVYVNLDRKITLEVNSYTDPVKSNLKTDDESIQSQMSKYNWSKNEVLSALRTEALLRQLKTELNVLVGELFTRPEAKIIIDRLNKKLSKTKIAIGTDSMKVKI